MKWLKKRGTAAMLAISVWLIMAFTTKAGPPFQTDDPEPVDFHHYEFYTFGNADGASVEIDTAGPRSNSIGGFFRTPNFTSSSRPSRSCPQTMRSTFPPMRAQAPLAW